MSKSGERKTLQIPDIGDCESIELLQWNFQPGETFEAGDELCELVTDKAAFSLEAPSKGRVEEILIPAKRTVSIGEKAVIVSLSE